MSNSHFKFNGTEKLTEVMSTKEREKKLKEIQKENMFKPDILNSIGNTWNQNGTIHLSL